MQQRWGRLAPIASSLEMGTFVISRGVQESAGTLERTTAYTIAAGQQKTTSSTKIGTEKGRATR